jgi:TPR repeat protein
MVCLRKIAYDRGLRCYHLGKYDKALRYFTWAESYHANAQYFLGRMYESGLGVPRDNHVALIWYRKAASRGHEDALGKLDTPEEESAR